MPVRSAINIRPKHQPGAISYSPQRDLAYMYPHAMREAVAGLDQAHWQDYFRPWLEAAGVTEEDLGNAVGKLMDAHALFIGDETITQPADALDRVGFFDLPHAARIMLFERLGEVMMGGFFIAIRDVTPLGDLPNNAVDLATMIGAGRVINERLTGVPKPTPDELHEQAKAAEALLAELRRAKDNGYRALQAAEQLAESYRRELQQLRKRTLWQIIRDWWSDRTTPLSKERAKSSGKQ